MSPSSTAAPKSRRLIGRKEHVATQPPMRVLTAAATTLDLHDRVETRRERVLRQGWQILAWTYRDSIGEFRYAVNFLANCTSRMKIYPAAYAVGGEADVPVALTDPSVACPPEVLAACNQALLDLGNGRMAISQLLHRLSTSWSTVGECFLVGREDPATGLTNWRIRSNQEILIYNDEWKLREVPMDPQGILGWITLDPDMTYIARMWNPHAEFEILADCPTRALISDMESLQLLRRMIRATARSRLASRGLLAIPNEFSIAQPMDDNLDVTADTFMDDFVRAVTTPLTEEGTAAEVVPVVARGPADTIKDIRWIEFASQFDQMSKDTRAELVGIIATGLDLPKEVIQGIADLNHWSAWQVDDNTFRHHVEPHVISCIDALTSGYLRPYLRNSAGISPDVAEAWADRVLFWYDPTELVTHPDQTADALNLHDRGVISNEALRRSAGFSEADAPKPDEFLAWLISKQRSWPPNVSEAVIHGIAPGLTVPAIATPGTIPGIDPIHGVVAPPPPPGAAPAGAPALPAPSGGDDGGTAAPATTQPGPPEGMSDGEIAGLIARLAMDDPSVTLAWALRGLAAARMADREKYEIALTAASRPSISDRDRALSQRLVKIDADLRIRLHTAANAAMQRVLEKAGTRILAKAQKDETMRAAIKHSRSAQIGQALGREAVVAAGFDPETLVPPDAWDALHEQFVSWSQAAQEQALATACQLAGISTEDESAQLAARKLAGGTGPAWDLMHNALNALAGNLLFDPSPAADGVALDALNPSTLVPTGVVRASLGVIGGYAPNEYGTLALKDGSSVPAPLGVPVGQVGTSSTISDLLTSNGATSEGYEWQHGSPDKPFDPHLDLDGQPFASFDDPVLANDGDWPDNAFFVPGDHNGCTCDFMPMWASASSDTGSTDEAE